jgi:hypothetical protein
MSRLEKFLRGWQIWKKRISVTMACVVVFVTVYAMVLPAITLDRNDADREEGVDLTENFGAEDDENDGWPDDWEDDEEEEKLREY